MTDVPASNGHDEVPLPPHPDQTWDDHSTGPHGIPSPLNSEGWSAESVERATQTGLLKLCIADLHQNERSIRLLERVVHDADREIRKELAAIAAGQFEIRRDCSAILRAQKAQFAQMMAITAIRSTWPIFGASAVMTALILMLSILVHSH